MTIDKKLKAFCRIDGMGRTVSTSLVFRKNKPKVGKWVEIENVNECCSPTTTSTTTVAPATTTTTSTTAEPVCRTYVAHGSIVARVALVWEDCEGEGHVIQIDGNEPYTFCAVSYSIQSPGTVELIADKCLLTTTTTTLPE